MPLRPVHEHEWRVPRRQAAAIQRSLAQHVLVQPLDAAAVRLAAGVDVSYARDGSRAYAYAVVMDRALRPVESAIIAGEPDAPYVRGYLAFREGRLTLEALLALTITPDVVFLDGHGVVHERGLGLASHIGVLLDVPTIGVPKTPFHAVTREPGQSRGDRIILTKEWGAAGAAVRLKARSKPVYVSPGHRVDLDSAIQIALEWTSGRHRVPEPLARAHTYSVLARNDGEAR